MTVKNIETGDEPDREDDKAEAPAAPTRLPADGTVFPSSIAARAAEQTDDASAKVEAFLREMDIEPTSYRVELFSRATAGWQLPAHYGFDPASGGDMGVISVRRGHMIASAILDSEIGRPTDAELFVQACQTLRNNSGQPLLPSYHVRPDHLAEMQRAAAAVKVAPEPLPETLWGVPYHKAPTLPAWLDAIILNQPGTDRVAISSSGKPAAISHRGDPLEYDGATWRRLVTAPEDGLCYLSLTPFEGGEATYSTDDRPDRLGRARIRRRAIDFIRDFDPADPKPWT